jgi:hypothetical protein
MDYREVLNISKFYRVRCMTIVTLIDMYYKRCSNDGGGYDTLFDMIDDALKMFDVDVKKRFIQYYYYQMVQDINPGSYYMKFTERYSTILHLRVDTDDPQKRTTDRRSRFNKKYNDSIVQQQMYWDMFAAYHKVLRKLPTLEAFITPSSLVAQETKDEYKPILQLLLEAVKSPASIDTATVKIHVDENAIGKGTSNYNSYSLPSVFASIPCDEHTPYVELVSKSYGTGIHWFKLYNAKLFPTRSLLTAPLADSTDDHIVLLQATHKANIATSSSRTVYDRNVNMYFDNVSTVRYIDVLFNVRRRLVLFKYDYRYDRPYMSMVDNICSMLQLPSTDEEHSYIVDVSDYVCTKIVPNLYVYPTLLEHLLRTSELFAPIRPYITIDERRRPLLHKTTISLRIRIGSRIVVATFDPDVAANDMKRFHNTKIYEGWSYTKIVIRNIENHYMFRFVDTLIQELLMEYINNREYLEDLYAIHEEYPHVPREYQDVPDIIWNFKKEVPELWVPNTSKQVDAKALCIVSDRLRDIYVATGERQVLTYPPEDCPVYGKYARHYVAPDSQRRYVGLIRNRMSSKDMFKLLPNAYTTDHTTKFKKHMSKYARDPNYHLHPDPQANINQVYKSDSAPRTSRGYAQIPIALQSIIKGTLDQVSYKLYRESLGDEQDKFIACIHHAMHNESIDGYWPIQSSTSLRMLYRSHVEERIHMCSQDLPYMTSEEMMYLYDSGANPCYFYRAFEDMFNINIMIFIYDRGILSVYPSNFIGEYLWEFNIARPLLVLLCFTTSRMKYMYEVVIKELVETRVKRYLLIPGRDVEEKINCLNLALYKHKFLSNSDVSDDLHDASLGTILSERIDSITDSVEVLSISQVLISHAGTKADQLYKSLVNNSHRCSIQATDKIPLTAATAQYISSSGKTIAIQYTINGHNIWVSAYHYPLRLPVMEPTPCTLDTCMEILPHLNKLITTVDPYIRCPDGTKLKYIDGLIDDKGFVYFVRTEVMTEAYLSLIEVDSPLSMVSKSTCILDRIWNIKIGIEVKHDILVTMLRHYTGSKDEMISKYVSFREYDVSSAPTDDVLDIYKYMSNYDLITEFDSWSDCYNYYLESGIMNKDGRLELGKDDMDSINSMMIKLDNDESIKLITPMKFLYTKVKKDANVLAFESKESFIGWRRTIHHNVILYESFQSLKEDYMLQVSVAFHRVLFYVKASHICTELECKRTITRWNESLGNEHIHEDAIPLHHTRNVHRLVDILSNLDVPIESSYHYTFIAYSKRQGFYVPLLYIPSHLGDIS